VVPYFCVTYMTQDRHSLSSRLRLVFFFTTNYHSLPIWVEATFKGCGKKVKLI
jgi:hypothetical protein